MSELYRALEQPRYEVIPMVSVEEQLDSLPDGATVAVTCSPSPKKGIEATLDLSEKIAAEGRDIMVVPHLAARMVESEGHLDDTLGRMAEVGIRSAFLVGGDAKDAPGKPYHGSLELAAAVRERDQYIQLGSTAYPEGHPDIDDETLMQDLLEKQQYLRGGSENLGYVATQMCFSPRKIREWEQEARDRGLELPVEVGVAGAVDIKKLLKISSKIGVGESLSYFRKNPITLARLALSGSYNPNSLIKKLSPDIEDPNSNLSGFHINTFNEVKRTEEWRQQMLEGHAKQQAYGFDLQEATEIA